MDMDMDLDTDMDMDTDTDTGIAIDLNISVMPETNFQRYGCWISDIEKKFINPISDIMSDSVVFSTMSAPVGYRSSRISPSGHACLPVQ
jgi:hypothetical protein